MVTKKSIFLNDQTKLSDLAYVRDIMQQPFLTKETEKELAQAWSQQRNEKSLHELVCSYSRLVVSIALKFQRYGLPMGDLIQEGNIGLMEAAKRFDPQRDIRFATYAKWWIRACIQDYVLRNWSIVRMGSTSTQRQLFFNLRRLRAQLSKVTGENMSQEERQQIADVLKVTLKDVEEMENRIASHDLSLNNSVNQDSHEDWVDTLEDTSPNPEDRTRDEFDQAVRNHWIQSSLRLLNPRERHIILLRHLSGEDMTLEELGKFFGVSKERVRQIERGALKKMKAYFEANLPHPEDMI